MRTDVTAPVSLLPRLVVPDPDAAAEWILSHVTEDLTDDEIRRRIRQAYGDA